MQGKQRVGTIALLALLGVSATTWAEVEPALAPATHTATGTCPPPMNRPPIYPVAMMRSGKGGTVLVDVATDACGRVVDAQVKRSSGVAMLDEAAITAARLWVLTPEQRAKQVDGRVEREVSFAMDKTVRSVSYAPLDWPRTHRRPRYELEPLEAFATARDASDAMKVDVADTIKPPYPLQSTFFRNRAASPQHEYWMFIYKAGAPTVAARYRLAGGEDDPLVKLALVCDGTPDACDQARAFLLRGLPFAKAQR